MNFWNGMIKKEVLGNSDILMIGDPAVPTQPKHTTLLVLKEFLNVGIEYVSITATRNAADFNSIRELVASIADASYLKRYVINIPEGRWFECDLHGKKYVEFKGAGIGKTVIYHDGSSNKLTPPDFSYIAEANKPLNTVANAFKHCIFTIDDIVARDITFESNYSKYVAHIDSPGLTNGLFENCKFIHLHTNTCVGMGIHSGQKIVFDKCIFNVVPSIYNGFYIHNIAHQILPASVEIKNCHFEHCHYMIVDELGSDQVDYIYLLNCTSDITAAIQYKTLTGFWTNPDTGLIETDPLKLPYCINVIADSTNLVLGGNNNYSNAEPMSRPKIHEYVKSDYAFRATIAGIAKYDLIQGIPGKIDSYAKYNGTGEFVGVAQTASDTNNIVYLAGRGKVVKASVSGASAPYININAGNLLEFSATKTSATVGLLWGNATGSIYFLYLI